MLNNVFKKSSILEGKRTNGPLQSEETKSTTV